MKSAIKLATSMATSNPNKYILCPKCVGNRYTTYYIVMYDWGPVEFGDKICQLCSGHGVIMKEPTPQFSFR